MYKNIFPVFAVLSCSLFVYSCTWPGSRQSCETNGDCQGGFECLNGVCETLDYVRDVRDIPGTDEIRDTSDIPDTPATRDTHDPTPEMPPLPCGEYVFQESSYVTSLRINNPVEEQPCCYDMGGVDNEIDNKLGGLLNALEGLIDFDANVMIADQIAAGAIVILFEFREFDDGASNDPSIIMPFFYGSIDGCTDYNCSVQSDAAAGNGTFTVSESSFLFDPNGCTGTPLIRFDYAYVDNNHLVAGPSVFELSLPILDFLLDVEIHNARVEAVLSYSSRGITMTDGKLGGAIPVESIIGGFNQYASSECSCLEVTNGRDLVTYEITRNGLVAECSHVTNHCGMENDICDMFGSMCGLLITLIADQADIDIDGDGVYESLSVGITFEGVSAQVAAP